MSKIQWKRSASLALMVIAGTQSWTMGQQRGTGARQPSAAPTQAGGGSNPAMANAASALANNGKSKGQGSVAIGNIPNVVATVNGQPISKADLGKECVLRYGDQVLENMLNKSLIMQACQAQQITISEKEVDDEIGRIATKFNLNTAMYLKLIEDERGIDPAQYKSDIIWPMLALRMLARDKIQITRQDIDQAMENEFGPTVKVRMIAVKDLAKAQQLHQQAMADPASFKQLAKMHSEDAMSASVEGLLQPIRRFSGDEKFEKLAFGLQPDQISQIVNIADLHIFLQCVRHEPATPPNRDQIPIIEERIRQALMDEKLHGMAEQIFTTLRSQSNVAKVFGDPAQQQQNPGVAAFINRQQIPMSMLEEECVRRHGAKVLEGEINRKLLEQALATERKQVTQQDCDLEIARAADFYGYIKPDKTPNVEAWLKVVLEEDGATLDLYVRDAVWPTVALKKLVEGKIQLTQEDLQRGFEASYGPRAEILAIVLSSQRTAQEVWQMARNNPTEQFFGELAAQYSVEPTSRSNYGKVPPLRKNSGQPTLEKAAFDLKAGDLSGIIESNGQFVILRGQGQTNPIVKDMNAVKGELTKDLMERKTRIAMEKHLDELLKKAMIENYILPKKSQVGTSVTREAARSASGVNQK